MVIHYPKAQKFHHARRHVDNKPANLPRAAGFQAIRDGVNMPVVEIFRCRIQGAEARADEGGQVMPAQAIRHLPRVTSRNIKRYILGRFDRW